MRCVSTHTHTHTHTQITPRNQPHHRLSITKEWGVNASVCQETVRVYKQIVMRCQEGILNSFLSPLISTVTQVLLLVADESAVVALTDYSGLPTVIQRKVSPPMFRYCADSIVKPMDFKTAARWSGVVWL